MIKKIKIKMLSQPRIEPTTAGVVAGIKIFVYNSILSISHVDNEPPFYLETTEELHCIVDYKGTSILTVRGFISATRRF